MCIVRLYQTEHDIAGGEGLDPLLCPGQPWSFQDSVNSHGERLEGGVPREQKMLKGHLPRVIHHKAYSYTKMDEVVA